jgi:lysyl-tRNA synthetase class I
MAIPDLFDAYDKCWEAYDKNGDEKLARVYVLSQIDAGRIPEKEKGFFAPRFRDVANYLSQGLTDKEVLQKIAELKAGKLDDSELGVLEERINYAKVWLSDYAPDDYRFEMTEEIPSQVRDFTPEQKEFLGAIPKVFDKDETPEALQINIYELSKAMSIKTKDAFAAIYIGFTGKTHGPRAGMLLSKFGKQKVFERINAILQNDKN